VVCLLAPPSWLAGAGSNSARCEAPAPFTQVLRRSRRPAEHRVQLLPCRSPTADRRGVHGRKLTSKLTGQRYLHRCPRANVTLPGIATRGRAGSVPARHHDGSPSNAERGEIAPPCAGHCDFLTKRCRHPNPSRWVRRVGSGLSDVELSPSVGPVAVSRRYITCRRHSSDPAHRCHPYGRSASAGAGRRRASMCHRRTVASGISNPSVPP
jgi:hypothetical protein